MRTKTMILPEDSFDYMMANADDIKIIKVVCHRDDFGDRTYTVTYIDLED